MCGRSIATRGPNSFDKLILNFRFRYGSLHYILLNCVCVVYIYTRHCSRWLSSVFFLLWINYKVHFYNFYLINGISENSILHIIKMPSYVGYSDQVEWASATNFSILFKFFNLFIVKDGKMKMDMLLGCMRQITFTCLVCDNRICHHTNKTF